MKPYVIVAALALLTVGATAIAQSHKNSYAGQHTRAVSSLSADELQSFLDGRGAGLARPAELNGYPGPMHVLELDRPLALTAEQRLQVQAAFGRMKAKATDLGAKYVEAERKIDAAFRSGSASDATIAAHVAEANRLLGEVRLSHLLAHLEVAQLLTPEQRVRYAELRGYGDGGRTEHRRQH
jgi:Spy/CpxP family protein refolding chaperone